MAFTTITDADMVGKGTVGLADTPGLSTTDMQKQIDSLSRELIVPKFNSLVSSELPASTAAAVIGAAVPDGLTAENTVQAVLQAVHTENASHAARTDNPHAVTKAQVGLGNVNNTADADKPVSTAAAASIKAVSDTSTAHIARTDNPHSVTKAQVGLGNVDNTSDANKPVSTATQTALDAKAPQSTTYTKTETDAEIAAKIKEIGAGDMSKSVYDTDNDGIVDNAEKLGGSLPSAFASASQGAEADALVAGTTPAAKATSADACTGNAATATKLATARNIGSAAFDGSANITLAQIGAATAAQGALASTAVQPAAISNDASCSLINAWSSANLTFRKVGNSVLFNMRFQNGLNPMASGTQIGTAPYAAAETTYIPCLVVDSGGAPVSQFAFISIDTNGVMRVWSNTTLAFQYWLYVAGNYRTA